MTVTNGNFGVAIGWVVGICREQWWLGEYCYGQLEMSGWSKISALRVVAKAKEWS